MQFFPILYKLKNWTWSRFSKWCDFSLRHLLQSETTFFFLIINIYLPLKNLTNCVQNKLVMVVFCLPGIGKVSFFTYNSYRVWMWMYHLLNNKFLSCIMCEIKMSPHPTFYPDSLCALWCKLFSFWLRCCCVFREINEYQNVSLWLEASRWACGKSLLQERCLRSDFFSPKAGHKPVLWCQILPHAYKFCLMVSL